MTVQPPQELAQALGRFHELVAEVRPELHRYCARIVGSVVEGEDIVQETLARSFYALSLATELPPLRPYLFRIAHNTAIDYLRRYETKHVEARADFDDMMGSPDDALDPELVRAAISSFLSLPLSQRSAVILKDVLGHSLEETAATMGTSVLSVKASLVRGRGALRALQHDAPANDRAAKNAKKSPRDALDREKLQRYVALFNTKDWDGLKAMLSDECRLDLVSKAERRGKGVHGYFGRYAAEPDARLSIGEVEGRPALFFHEREGAKASYFMFLTWEGEQLTDIRDYRYVPYVVRDL